MSRKPHTNDCSTPQSDFAEASSAVMLANENPLRPRATLIGLANEFSPESRDGWHRVAPYGNTEHTGSGKSLLQVFDVEAANEMVRGFKAKAAEYARSFKGAFKLPIFVGHPDNKYWAKDNPARIDDKAYGWVDDLDARSDGLYARTGWSQPGELLVANEHYRFFSPHWAMRLAQGNLARPFELISLGLVNRPNFAGDAIANEQPESNHTMKEYLAKLLAALGFTEAQTEAIANEASDRPSVDDVVSKVTTIANGKVHTETELANEKSAHAATQAALQTKATALEEKVLELANERTQLIETLAENAVLTGRVSVAERKALVVELANDFAGRSKSLEAAPVRFKIAPVAKDYAGHQQAADKDNQILALANEWVAKRGVEATPEHLAAAFGHLRRSRPDLFQKPSKS